jgi:hypothetical protein
VASKMLDPLLSYFSTLTFLLSTQVSFGIITS